MGSTETEERTSELKDVTIEIVHCKNRKKINGAGGRGSEQILKNVWDHKKRLNTSVMKVREGEKKRCGAEKAFREIMVKNVPKNINLQIQEAEQTPNYIKKSMPSPTILLKTEDKIKMQKERNDILPIGVWIK